MRTGPSPRRLSSRRHPVVVVLDLPPVAESAATVEFELRGHAAKDGDNCCGYFPGLEGAPGITSDLPACRAFARRLPVIRHGGADYRFSFLRLSLRQQSVDPAYHLDSDAATALTGDVATLSRRRVGRLLLNLSSRCERTLHYLDVDPGCVDLVAERSYVRAADPRQLSSHARTATIAARRDSKVVGLLFAANQVLHSGVDDAGGHFVAAYGTDEMEDSAAVGRPA